MDISPVAAETEGGTAKEESNLAPPDLAGHVKTGQRRSMHFLGLSVLELSTTTHESDRSRTKNCSAKNKKWRYEP